MFFLKHYNIVWPFDHSRQDQKLKYNSSNLLNNIFLNLLSFGKHLNSFS